jgi:hypothetical protein
LKPVTFKVTAKSASGPLRSTYHDTPKEALARAVELMARVLADVHIVDRAGRSFTPAEFAMKMDDLMDKADSLTERRTSNE